MRDRRILGLVLSRIVAALSAVTLIAVAFVGLTAAPAIAAPAGSISGKVTAAAGGANLSGICVNAYVRGLDATLVSSTATAADGTYTLSAVPVGNIDVRFDGSSFCPNGTETNVVNQWWNNQLTEDTAAAVSVADGVTTPNINAAMVAGGTITGKVTAAVGGANLSGICVGALIPGVDELLVANTATIADGTYRLIGVPAGDVHVQFYASGFCPDGSAQNYVTEWYNNQPVSASADLIHVTAGATSSGINAALDASGSFSGKVTAAAGGAPIEGVCVAAYKPFVSGVVSQLIDSTGTLPDGTYTLTGAPLGHIDVKFYSTGFCPGGVASNYTLQWFNNQPSQDVANEVNITSTNTPNINASMAAAGTITGTVTATAGGAPINGICVAAFSTDANPVVVASTGTLSDGTYTLDGVPPSTVRVRFNSQGFCPGGIFGHYATQWSNDKADFTSANDIVVTAGGTNTGVNAVMDPPVATSFSIKVNGVTSTSINHGLTATLSETGLPATYGTVVFSAPGQPNLCTITFPGVATSCTTSAALAVGSYTPISAAFTDTDGAFTSSTSTNTVSLGVNAIATSFSIKVNGGSTASITHGQQATLSETGLPGGATGSVVFGSPGHANLCTITLPATSCQTSTGLAVGSYSPITAVFTDTDGGFAGSTSSGTNPALTVGLIPTPFTIAVDGGVASTVLHGGVSTLSAAGLPGPAAGSVVFSSTGNPNLCTITLPATSCQTSAALAVGSYSPISAVFTATDGIYAASTATNTVALTIAPNPTSFSIKVNGVASSTIVHGAKATLSAAGLPVLATGTVRFSTPKNANLCTITLPATTCQTSAALAVGSYTPITATFTPADANFLGSVSGNTATLKDLSKPGAPTHVRASKPGAKKATITWVAPVNAGGTAITGFLVTYGGKSMWVSAKARKATFVGLSLGQYHFRVRAINKIGAGAWSSASNLVKIVKTPVKPS